MGWLGTAREMSGESSVTIDVVSAQKSPRGGGALLGVVPTIAAFVAGLIGQQLATELGWSFLLLASCAVIALVAAWARWYRRGIIRWWWFLVTMGSVAAAALGLAYQSQDGPRTAMGITGTALVCLASVIVVSDDAINRRRTCLWVGVAGFAVAAVLVTLKWDEFAWYHWAWWSAMAIASAAAYVVGVWSPPRRPQTPPAPGTAKQPADLGGEGRAGHSGTGAGGQSGRFELYTKGGHYYWRLRAGNGRVLAVGLQFDTKAAAATAVNTVQRNIGNPERFALFRSGGKYYWQLRGDNGQIIAGGGDWDSESAARADRDVVMQSAPKAPIVDQTTSPPGLVDTPGIASGNSSIRP